jgi:hypothetical protein
MEPSILLIRKVILLRQKRLGCPMGVNGNVADVKEQVDNTAVRSGDIAYYNSVNPIAQGCTERC